MYNQLQAVCLKFALRLIVNSLCRLVLILAGLRHRFNCILLGKQDWINSEFCVVSDSKFSEVKS